MKGSNPPPSTAIHQIKLMIRRLKTFIFLRFSAFPPKTKKTENLILPFWVPKGGRVNFLCFFIPKIPVFWKQVKFQKMFSHYKKFASLDSLGFWKTLFDDIANLNFPFKNWKTRKI